MNARERCGGRLSSPVCRLLFAACRLTFGRLFDRWGAVRCGKITAQGEKKLYRARSEAERYETRMKGGDDTKERCGQRTYLGRMGMFSTRWAMMGRNASDGAPFACAFELEGALGPAPVATDDDEDDGLVAAEWELELVAGLLLLLLLLLYASRS